MTDPRQRLGRRAEDLVARRLQERGWDLVESNARTRTGEIDIIALDGSTLVFVEVKAGRSGSPTGPVSPAHAVGPRKQAKIRLLAREWLGAGRCPSGVAGYRFDVVGVLFGRGTGTVEFDHIRNAF